MKRAAIYNKDKKGILDKNDHQNQNNVRHIS